MLRLQINRHGQKHITVKLNASALNAEQEQKLKDFLEDLIQSEE